MTEPPHLPPLFRALVKEHRACVARVVRRGGVPEGDCPDAASKVFEIAWRQRDQLYASHNHKAWLLRVARGVCANYRKLARTKQEVLAQETDVNVEAPSDALDPEEVLLAREARALVNELIADELVPERADVMLMHLEDVPATAIATTLGIPKQTVYDRIKLATQDLKFAMARRRTLAVRPSTRRLLALPPAELLRLDAAAGPGFDDEIGRRVFGMLFGDDATSGPDDGERYRRSDSGELGATAQSPPALDLPAHPWGLLAHVAPIGRWLASQAPGAVMGAGAVVGVLALSPPPTPVAIAVPSRDAQAFVATPAPGTANAPTSAAGAPGAPPIRAALSALPTSATASTGHGGALALEPDMGSVLQRAQTENMLNNPKAALATLKRVDNAPRSQSDEARDIMQIDAMIRLGNMTEAQKLGRAFRQKYPRSMQLPRLDAMLGKKP